GVAVPRGPVFCAGVADGAAGDLLRRGVPVSPDDVAGEAPADEHTKRTRLRTVRLIVIGNHIAVQVLLLCVALLEVAMLAEGSALRLTMMFIFMVLSVFVFMHMYR